MSSQTLVEAIGVQKSYGDFSVLDDLTCRIEPGVTGILGANGAGKTTFLSMILGLHDRTGGTLKVLGHDPSTSGSLVRERIGYGPEHHTLPPDLRAAEFVKHIGEIHGLPPGEATVRASDALWLVDLGEERFRPMGTMSTGQRQRVKLAQAIVHDPALVLLDEPTDGLDPGQRDTMLALIKSIASDFDVNVVISSHLIDEVERVCDAAIIIGDGRAVAAGPIDQLRTEVAPGLLLEVEGERQKIESLVAELEDAGFSVEVDGPRLTVRDSAADSDGGLDRCRNAVRDGLADHGLGLVRLHSQAASLEEVFIQRMYRPPVEGDRR